MSLFIDLSKIQQNVKCIKEYTQKDVMAVIKSNAYGLGSKTIIKTLFKCGITWVVYNTYQEYLKDKVFINDSKIKVLILESITSKMLDDNYDKLYFSINSSDDVEVLNQINKKCNIHIRINSGMNRLGLKSINEFKMVIKKLKINPYVLIDGVYTHFASNENEYNYYEMQVNEFKKYLKLYKFNNIHTSSTSSLHKNIVGNMVRVGMAIYGYGNHYLNLKPCVTLNTNVLDSFKIFKGEYVGYDMTYKAENNEYVNIIPIGYYDIRGIDHIYYNNELYPLIGKICMNHAFFVTNFKIKKITKLIVLSKNDIIRVNYNWYQILTSLETIPKNYIMRGNYDISEVYSRTKFKTKGYKFRKRSY